MRKLAVVFLNVLLLTMCAVTALAIEPLDTECAHEWSETFTSTEDGWHYSTCKKCGDPGALIACSGGTATCSARARCDVCNGPHGNTLPHDYANGAWGSDAGGHWRICPNCSQAETDNVSAHSPVDEDCTTEDYCSKCNYKTAEAETGHQLTIGAPKDTASHIMECTNPGCAYTEDQPHTFDQQVTADTYWENDANCTTAETYYYSCLCGQKGTDTFTVGAELGHDFAGGTWISTDAGYHWKMCSRCDAEDTANKVGHQYLNYTSNGDDTHTGTCECSRQDTGACSGGIATCIDRAVCDICNEEHGSIWPDGHDYSGPLIPGETTHYYECSRCHLKKNEAPHKFENYTSQGDDTHSTTCTCGKVDTQDCAGGTATCTERAVCDVCGGEHGSTDPNNHDFATTLTQGTTTHYYACSRCTARDSEAPHEYENSTSNGDDTHTGTCLCGKTGTQSCSGGTATCTEEAICDSCGGEHGSIDPNNHDFATTLTPGTTTHYYECSRCQARDGETAHDYKNHTSNGNSTHTGTCSCGAVDTEACSGGTATCTEKALCDVCGGKHGSIDPNNHDFATTLTPGTTTHYYECSRCQAKNGEQGHSYGTYTSNGDDTHSADCVCGAVDTKNCSGGTANCTEKALCTVCGGEHGALDPYRHDFATTLTQGSVTHYYECSRCQHRKNEEDHQYGACSSNGNGTHDGTCICGKSGTESCYGGLATCTAKAVCSACDSSYGSIDPLNHRFTTELKQGESTHYYACTRCYQRKNEQPHEYADHSANGDDTHTGTCACGKQDTDHCAGNDASATCQWKASCDTCGGSYGAYADHQYDTAAWGYKDAQGHAHVCKTPGCTAHDALQPHVPGGEATEETAQVCTGCGYVIKAALGHTEHTPEDSWTADDTHHWKDCTDCPDQQLEKGEHKYDNACDPICNTCGHEREITHDYQQQHNASQHWQACTVCGEEKADSRDAHSGGTATCIAQAQCQHCGAGYGELAPHDFDLSQWGYQTQEGHAHACKTPGCDAHDDLVSHVPGGTATEGEGEKCVDCGFEIKAPADHTTHTPKDEWTGDDQYHWHECEDCTGQQLEKGTHEFDSDCDEDCNICDQTREAEHKFTVRKHDDKKHWFECICGAVSGETDHVFGDDGICGDCAYEKDAKGGLSGGAIVGIIIGLLVLGGIGFWFFWLLILKKKDEDEEEEENAPNAPQGENK